MRDATDQGFPLGGAWRVKFGEKKPRLESGIRCWRAEAAPGLDLQAAYRGPEPLTLQVLWKRLDDDNYDSPKSLSVKLNPDGEFHTYHLELGGSLGYRGLITGLALEPATQPKPGEEMAIRSIVLGSFP
jgi:hypothetical protein